MAIAITDNLETLKRFVETDFPLRARECDANGSPLTTGDGTQFVSLGAIKQLDLNEILDEFKDKGASGNVVQHEAKVEQYELPVTLHQRDKQSRLLTRNAEGKYYQFAVHGATLGTQTEFHVAFGKIMPGFQYPMTGEGKLSGIKIVTISNTAAISVTLPTDWATGTITIAARKMWNTDDV